MAENKWHDRDLDDLRAALDKALTGLNSEQQTGTRKVMVICHGLWGVIETLRAEMKKLQERRLVVCAFCDMEFPGGGDGTVKDTKGLEAHMRTCEKHPMRALEKKNKRLLALLEKAELPVEE